MKTFSLHDVQAAWKEYESVRVLRVLKDGKWETKALDGERQPRINGTSAAIKPLKDVMDFPEYLGELWTR